MFCPKCGSPFAEDGGYLYCPAGDMQCSPDMDRRLRRRYAGEGEPPSPLPAFYVPLHGDLRWYCPGCGIRLNDQAACPRCGRNLRDLVYHLIELHPHR